MSVCAYVEVCMRVTLPDGKVLKAKVASKGECTHSFKLLTKPGFNHTHLSYILTKPDFNLCLSLSS